MENDYLIRKKPLPALLLFSLPMVLGNLFQQLYTLADSAIVGRYVGEQALAAVGASYALTNIFICVAIGGGIGASVAVSRYFGAKEYRRMKLALYTACLAFLGVSILLGGLGLGLSRWIMEVLRTPEDVLGISVEYLNIYFLGLPFLFLYNVFSSMFNALGKSRIPLYFLIFSSVFNVALDMVFVTRFDMGVAGAAWATLIAQGISAVLSFGVLLWELRRFPCEKPGVFSRTELMGMTRIALPSILQQSTVSIGMMLVQSVVNSFGSEALAGFSAAMRVESICIVPMTAFGNALSSYTAQNLGAKQQERVVKGYHAANKMVLASAVLICICVELLAKPLGHIVPGDRRHGCGIRHRRGLSHIHGLVLLSDRVQNGGGRAAAWCRRHENVHHRQSGESEHPGNIRSYHGAPVRHSDGVVRRTHRLVFQLAYLVFGVPDGKVAEKSGCIFRLSVL